MGFFSIYLHIQIETNFLRMNFYMNLSAGKNKKMELEIGWDINC